MGEFNGKYVNEENHQKVKRTLGRAGRGLLVGGIIMILAGIALLVTGIVTVVNSEDISFTVAFIPLGGFIFFGGVIMTHFGIMAKFASHARDIASYGASTIFPVASDAMNYTADNIAPAVGRGISNLGKGIGDAAGEIAGGVARGVRQAKRDLPCPNCGELNANDAKFCAKCGTGLAAKTKANGFCPNCGDPTEEGQKFCEKCGQKLAD